jgi:hypothetical protein
MLVEMVEDHLVKLKRLSFWYQKFYSLETSASNS